MSRFSAFMSFLLFLLPAAAAAQQPPEFKEAYRAYTERAERQKFRQAIPHARKALDIALKSDAFNDEARGKLAYNLGYALFRDHRLTDAAAGFSTAIEMLEKAPQADSKLIAEALLYRGVCYRALLQGQEAATDLRRAISMLTGTAPLVRLTRADALENLAWVLLNMRQPRLARTHADEALQIYSTLLPPRHPHTLRVMVLVSATYYVDGRRGRALSTLAAAAAEAEKAGLVTEPDGKKASPNQFSYDEYRRFHDEVSHLYELMGRRSDADYHRKIVEDLRKGVRPAAMRATPLDRPLPRYPHLAARRGKTGWILIEFTIRKDGSTGDIRVVDTAPKGTFERAATDAVRKWRYEPPTEDGKPVDVPRVRTFIRFRL